MKLKIMAMTVFVALLLFSLAGCVQNDGSSGITTSISKGESDISWSDYDTKITLNGSSAAVSGTGATVNGNVVTVTNKGTYVVSGTLSDGQIVIAAKNTDKVQLVLNGVDITNKKGAPIYASQCDRLTVTLAGGTTNTLNDGGLNFQYIDIAEKEPNGALFCKDDLTIDGTGGLTVNADFNNGIVSKDDLLIVSGDITVNALNHGLRGNDSVTVLDGTLSINAGNDGIQTNNDKDSSLGWVLIKRGTIMITAGHDGIQADTRIGITGGTLNITTNSRYSQNTTSDSFKGIKAADDISITSGTIFIDSEDDGIHSKGDITLDGGTIMISSGDDGIHADGDLTVNSGTIKVGKAYEGLEGANIVINGGNIDLVTSDDAINGAGGSDQSGGRHGKGGFVTDRDYGVTIDGGNITLLAGGDGIDSNGTINISGGEIIAIIDSSPDNGALDADREVTFTGGTIIYGGTGMGSAPGENSTQSYVYVSSGIIANKEITVKKDGQTLIAYTPTTSLKSLALSSPSIKRGDSYEIYIGDSLLPTVIAGSGGRRR